MTRRAALAAVAATLVLAGATPAWAHEEISPSTVPVGKPVFLTLSVANEKSVDLNRVTLTPPSGLELGETTRDPTGWAVNRTKAAATWSGGTVKPNRFEQFGFEIEGADQAGALTFKAALAYADGSQDNVDVPVSATVTSSSGDSATSAGSGDGDSDTLAVVALLVAVAALAVAALSLLRGRRPSTASAPAAATSGREQDW